MFPAARIALIALLSATLSFGQSGVPDTFLRLRDTPDTYSGQALKVVRVNAAQNALEFATIASGATTFLALTDTPSSYSGQAGKAVRVNAGETALEFFTASGSGTVTQVDTGSGLTGGPITTTGTVDLANVSATSHQWFDSVVSNVFHKSQPAIADLSDASSVVQTSRTISTTAPITGGGDLSANRTFAMHVADTTHDGYLSSTDWNTFDGKQNALTFGNLTDAGTDGIVVTGGTGAVIGSGTSLAQHVADSTHNGYLSSTDWNTFNTSATGSWVPTTRSLTIGPTTADLSADRTFLGSVTNDAQTKAAIVPNTAPSSGQILIGNAGGTAYAKKSVSGSGATISLDDTGLITISAIANASLANSAITIAGTSTALGASITQDTITGLSTVGLVKRTGSNALTTITDSSSNWDTAFTDRLKWDGGATGLVAATGRSSLGLVIGTNVQAWDTQLDSLAGLSYTGNSLKVVRVNSGETAFELATPSGGGTIASTTNILQGDGAGNAVASDISDSGGGLYIYANPQNNPTEFKFQNRDAGSTASSSITVESDGPYWFSACYSVANENQCETVYGGGAGNLYSDTDTPSGGGVTLRTISKASFDGGRTIASGAAAVFDDLNLAAATTTITGTTTVATAKGFNKASIYKPTLTDSSSVTVTNASSLYIEDAPAAAGSVTITNKYPLWVDNGAVRFDGGLTVGGTAAPSTGVINASTGFTIGGAASSGKILVGDGTNYIASTPTFPNASATSGKFIRSDGTNWIASTPTLPTSAGSAGKILRSDGTNYIESTPTFANTAGTAGKVLVSDGTNFVTSTPTFPNASATNLKIIKSDGTNWVASTETYAAPSTSGNIMQSDGTNWTSTTNTGGWTVLKVASSDFTTTSASLTDITGLVSGTLSTATLYEFEAVLYINSTTTAGVQLGVQQSGTGSGQIGVWTGTATNAAGTALAIGNNALNTAGAACVLVNGDGQATMKGFIKTGSSGSPTISCKILKVTSGTAKVYINSVMRYRTAGS